jgi:hypothetical protein
MLTVYRTCRCGRASHAPYTTNTSIKSLCWLLTQIHFKNNYGVKSGANNEVSMQI